MPTRKRQATSTPVTDRAKRARVADNLLEDESDTVENKRPKRTSADDETATDSHVPKRRGRPPKNVNAASTAPLPAKRARGRPPSVAKATKQEPAATTPRKRGRPSLKAISPDEKSTDARRSGKNVTRTASKGPDEPAKRGRGRPPKGTHTAQPSNGHSVPMKRGRGRPPKARPASTLSTTATSEDSGTDETDTEDNHLWKDGRQFWLLKAEPNDRFENGHNVKFSIDDLAAATEPEPWDGVRNYVARNNMRAMRKDDLAFFYHSNCKDPGIVGAMRIVEEHSVDETAFDPKHPYYDRKSTREAPKWDIVRVEFLRKFDKPMTLKMIQQNAATTGELADMEVLKYKRLSVTAVTPYQWEKVLWFLEEALDIGFNDYPNGYFRYSDHEDHPSDTDDEELFFPITNGSDEDPNARIKMSEKAGHEPEGANDAVVSISGSNAANNFDI